MQLEFSLHTILVIFGTKLYLKFYKEIYLKKFKIKILKLKF